MSDVETVALAPAASGSPVVDDPDVPRNNPLYAMFGSGVIELMPEPKWAPRTQRRGKEQVPHPDGGFRAVIARILFPTEGIEAVMLDGAVFADVFDDKNGKPVTEFSIWLPFLRIRGRLGKVDRELYDEYLDYLALRFATYIRRTGVQIVPNRNPLRRSGTVTL